MKPELKKAAAELLDEHKTIAAAADALSAKLARDNALRLAAAFFILAEVNLPARPLTANGSRAERGKELQSRRRPGPHRRPAKMPTRAQKTGAIRAEQTYVETIFDRKLRGGRKLGDVRLHELRAIAESSAQNAVSFLTRGYEDAVEVIACTMLSKYCVASDPLARIRDVIKPTVASKIFDQAKIKAAEELRDGSDKLAKNLIALAQAQELPAS